ncbi:hypothetical protein, partial [[Kitasatospora] papulosa]|uniref:hypothetical protein n=1 Tax=[Kitasatospora] papulosa TaxID=1464011 RepID=UPI0036946F02
SGHALRSSAAPEGDRHEYLEQIAAVGKELRSSAAPEGDRHQAVRGEHPGRRTVAILGRPGGRPPRWLTSAFTSGPRGPIR